MAWASLGNTPRSASDCTTSDGTVMRARCGAPRHCEVSRLHIDSHERSVLVPPMANGPKLAPRGSPA